MEKKERDLTLRGGRGWRKCYYFSVYFRRRLPLAAAGYGPCWVGRQRVHVEDRYRLTSRRDDDGRRNTTDGHLSVIEEDKRAVGEWREMSSLFILLLGCGRPFARADRIFIWWWLRPQRGLLRGRPPTVFVASIKTGTCQPSSNADDDDSGGYFSLMFRWL